MHEGCSLYCTIQWMSPDSADADRAPVAARWRSLDSLLALVILVLLLQVAWQAMRLSALKADLVQCRLSLDQSVERRANEKLRGRREELVRAVDWLDDFYRSPDGLQRPSGLWRPDANKPDGEALAVWILDVYLNARNAGATEDAARQAVIAQIRATDEWRSKHQ